MPESSSIVTVRGREPLQLLACVCIKHIHRPSSNTAHFIARRAHNDQITVRSHAVSKLIECPNLVRLQLHCFLTCFQVDDVNRPGILAW